MLVDRAVRVCPSSSPSSEHAFVRLLPHLLDVMTSLHLREIYQPAAIIELRANFVVDIGPRAPTVGEADRRRFTFLHCSGARVGDGAYFEALHAAIHDAGAVSAVRGFLRIRAMRLWARAREKLRARTVVLYWLGLTEHLMAPGGPAEARDREAYEQE